MRFSGAVSMDHRAIYLVLGGLVASLAVACGFLLGPSPTRIRLAGIRPRAARERQGDNVTKDTTSFPGRQPKSIAQELELPEAREMSVVGVLIRDLRLLAHATVSDQQDADLNVRIARQLDQLVASASLNADAVDLLLASSEPAVVREAGIMLLVSLGGEAAFDRLSALAQNAEEDTAIRLRAVVSGGRLLRTAHGHAADAFRQSLEELSGEDDQGLLADLSREALAGSL